MTVKELKEYLNKLDSNFDDKIVCVGVQYSGVLRDIDIEYTPCTVLLSAEYL